MTAAAKLKPTQEILSDLHDRLELAIGFVDCVYHALGDLTSIDDEVAGSRKVLDDAVAKLKATLAIAHDLVEWA